ncbi:ferrous iron transport protein A [Sphingomonas sp. So64.6b]|uniref:FeoA family protein n=1 Tax=Sphingomonas sp. So64.6b TaxID=2997354 RepID=UPI0015FF8ECE|nr:FeoA family protein [Sphingomonas sp. So64.6b]QNA85783.1 ferrous iron transport protein A [Sphingomonas sp. So64.6b]
MDAVTTIAVPISLESLPRGQRATVAGIDWQGLSIPEARRLRELGFDEGVGIEVLHRSPLGQGPMACRIGRMTVALRRAVAGTIHVAPIAG